MTNPDAPLTATSMMTARERQAQEQRYFAQALEAFIHQWSPEDGCDRQHFQQEVYFLIQRAQTLAQEPLAAQLAAAYAVMPFPGKLTL